MNITYVLIAIISLIIIAFLFNRKNSSHKMNEFTIVLGIIEEIYSQEIPNKALGKPPRVETKIKLNLIEVYDYKNRKISPAKFDYPTFAGDEELIEDYQVGDRVKIVCTSKTGRHIEKIEKTEN